MARCLPSFTCITSLSFQPWLTGQAAHEAFTCIQRLPRLVCLDLSGTFLTAATSEALRSTLKCMPALQSLTLAECGVNDSSLRVLLPALCGLSCLEALSLEGNKLFAHGSVLLATRFCHMRQLTRLNISNTCMSQLVIQKGWEQELMRSIAGETWACPADWTCPYLWLFCKFASFISGDFLCSDEFCCVQFNPIQEFCCIHSASA